MDLSRCTPGQYSIVTTLDKPLMVSAGAGSGKTFTVTQRVVHALCDDEAASHIESLDEALIITFTKEAAKELRERIKNLLLEEGRGDLALQADNAWISTIHGMASQILKQNALDFGLDPAFELISDGMVETLTDEALEIVVDTVKERGTAYQKAYLANTPLVSMGPYKNSSSVKDEVEKLLGAVRSMPEGFDGLVIPQAVQSPQSLLRHVIAMANDYLANMLTWNKPGKTILGVIDRLQDGIAAAQEYLASATLTSSSKETWFDESFDAEAYVSIFALFPATSEKFRRENQEGYDQTIVWRTSFAYAYYEAVVCCSLPNLYALVDIAQAVDETYHKLKGVDRLDNTDLLVLLLQSFKEHPDIAKHYRDRFKLIMVDEFQDTDKLQVAVIDYLAQPQRTNITTVGDAQQSIYRFRGADVNVFFDYRVELATNPIAQFIELPDNFRSHADILAFVEAIFSQPDSFGKDFLALQAKGAVNQEDDDYFSEHPRIEVAFIKASKKAYLVQEQARLIAQYCSELVAAGKKSHDIALLLGSMTNAHIYAQALRDKGLDALISGGSVYKNFPETQLVSDLLAFAINHDDDEALYRVLTSGAFDLSNDALLYLTSRQTDHGIARTRLSKTFLALHRLLEPGQEALETSNLSLDVLSQADRSALCRASHVLHEFEQMANHHEDVVIDAIRVLLFNSGYYARLTEMGTQGMSVAGNINKSLRLLAELQIGAPSLPALRDAYLSHVAFAKEKPGILQSSEMRSVRIMTTHSSKGLEFPHVIVADLGNGAEPTLGLIAENIGKYTYFTQIPSQSKFSRHIPEYFDEYAYEHGLTEKDPKQMRDTCSPAEILSYLKAYNKDQVLSEARRLLYVALTRASKSLFLLCPAANSSKKEEDLANIAKGIYCDVESTLSLDPQGSVQMISYGGSAPARVRVLVASQDEQDDPEEQTAEHTESLPQKEGETPYCIPYIQFHPLPELYQARRVTRGEREQVYSYSSLSHDGYQADNPDDEFVACPVATYGFDEEQEIMGSTQDVDDDFWDNFGDEDEEVATHLGTAFHHLCEQAIVDASKVSDNQWLIERPDKKAQDAQARRFALSHEQCVRLDQALDRWFASDLLQSFASFGDLQAEVPFMVQIKDPNSSYAVYLEGEIDGLACNDATAMFIDYKTGGSPEESDDVLRKKHLQQAQCYACALMKQGYEKVRAYFVRVEQVDPRNPTQPQIVSYYFEQSDLPDIEQAILAHAH